MNEARVDGSKEKRRNVYYIYHVIVRKCFEEILNCCGVVCED